MHSRRYLYFFLCLALNSQVISSCKTSRRTNQLAQASTQCEKIDANDAESIDNCFVSSVKELSQYIDIKEIKGEEKYYNKAFIKKALKLLEKAYPKAPSAKPKATDEVYYDDVTNALIETRLSNIGDAKYTRTSRLIIWRHVYERVSLPQSKKTFKLNDDNDLSIKKDLRRLINLFRGKAKFISIKGGITDIADITGKVVGRDKSKGLNIRCQGYRGVCGLVSTVMALEDYGFDLSQNNKALEYILEKYQNRKGNINIGVLSEILEQVLEGTDLEFEHFELPDTARSNYIKNALYEQNDHVKIRLPHYNEGLKENSRENWQLFQKIRQIYYDLFKAKYEALKATLPDLEEPPFSVPVVIELPSEWGTELDTYKPSGLRLVAKHGGYIHTDLPYTGHMVVVSGFSTDIHGNELVKIIDPQGTSYQLLKEDFLAIFRGESIYFTLKPSSNTPKIETGFNLAKNLTKKGKSMRLQSPDCVIDIDN